MRGFRGAVVVLVGLAVWASPGGAEQEALRVPRVTGSITVDGILDEVAWQEALSIDMAFEVEPGENVPPPVQTELLLAYGQDALYAAFRAFDPEPEAIRAHLWDRDNIGPDDWIALVLDTFASERWNYTLLVNPLGVQSDFIEMRNAPSVGWDGIWDSAARIEDWGWAVEIRVPFTTLRFPRTEGEQVWRVDGVRSYPRSVRHHIGAFPRDRANSCYLCQAIEVRGFSGAEPGRSLELDPTMTVTRTDERADLPGGPWEQGDADLDAGLTAHWGVTPNLTVSGTLNPDFSQVEADALQLDINEPFALFFEEKRPFFLEGNQYFSTLLQAVYTRTMRDPAWGAKVSGREGDHTVGAYVVRDEVTNLLFPGSESSSGTSLNVDNTSAVARYAYDFNPRLSLGTLLAGRRGDGYANQVGGIDGRAELSDSDRIAFQVLYSDTEYPDEVAQEFDQPSGSFRDWAGQLELIHDARNLDAWLILADVGEGFRADLGFIPRVDYRQVMFGSDYTWYPDRGQGWFTSLNLHGQYQHVDTQDGSLLTEDYELAFTYQGRLQSHSMVQINHLREGFSGEVFDLDQLYLHHCMKPNGHSHVFVNLWAGDRVDYVNARAGERVRVNPGMLYSLGRHLRLDLRYTWERMESGSERLFTANAADVTVAYQFDPRTFLRAIVQWVDYDSDPDRYTNGGEPQRERLFTQLLFSYKVNPRTVLFVGYSDTALGARTYGLTRVNRTLFAKVGYAWAL